MSNARHDDKLPLERHAQFSCLGFGDIKIFQSALKAVYTLLVRPGSMTKNTAGFYILLSQHDNGWSGKQFHQVII
ncbi:hypothetical protein SDC9_201262 [bioreactor metagenome]|uniref:Uncharacterized protein n=1 Tax=bioreactor metagenome TaxID=1076179 RepID=A0A645IQF2_9ZZZZ